MPNGGGGGAFDKMYSRFGSRNHVWSCQIAYGAVNSITFWVFVAHYRLVFRAVRDGFYLERMEHGPNRRGPNARGGCH
jgi:hypothetical protein